MDLHKSNILYIELLKKSLLTENQLAIIYKKVQGEKFDFAISAGAYYRQIGQCKSKIKRTLYTILLLCLISSLEEKTFLTMEKLASQLSVISTEVNHRDLDIEGMISVIRTIDDILSKLIKM